MARVAWAPGCTYVAPMLATLGEAPLQSASFAYEPKYDGVRAIVQVMPGARPTVTIWSRTGRDTSRQFPEVVAALAAWGTRLTHPVLLDGEIVATAADGSALGFQHLQSRIHRTRPDGGSSPSTAFIAFDILRAGTDDVRPLPFRERRRQLAALLTPFDDPHVRIADHVAGDGRALQQQAANEGWEGLVAKHLDAPYQSGARTNDWRKVKLVRRLSAVVGGWTVPRGLRRGFGALILGQYDREGRLVHVGQVGTGFSDADITRLAKQLATLATPTCPFAVRPTALAKAQWVTPVLVAEVAFMEWTQEGRLRHPIFLGLRADTPAPQVIQGNDLEESTLLHASATRGRGAPARRTARPSALADIIRHLEHTADQGGTLELPDGGRLVVNHLRKVLWPGLGLTKGDLLRHYALVVPALLPALADRPLVMKRYPNGVAARPFFQHRAPDAVPAGVRVQRVEASDGPRPYLVGGNLATLLYTAQLAAISQDPWSSRVGSADHADYVVFDLDPPEGMAFARVLEVARALKTELDVLGATAYPKTSGSRGLHLYVRVPPRTPHEAAQLYAKIVATVVVARHPALATIERSIAARRGRIYVDTLQNAHGKTLASVYSARANAMAGISTPLTWDEIARGRVVPGDFTIPSFAARLAVVGDLWAGLARATPAALLAVSRYGGNAVNTRSAPRRRSGGA